MGTTGLDSLQLRQQIRACRACPLGSLPAGSVPPSIPASPRVPRILVIGEGPGRQEARHLRPFVGPTGQFARKMAIASNIDPDSIAWANVIQCWPARTPPTPTDEELHSCAANVSAIITHIAPSYVLLFGAVALGRFAPGKRIGEFRGQWFQHGTGADRYWVMATYHPAAVLRNRGLEKVTRGDVEEFAFYALGVFEPIAGQVEEKTTRRKRYWQQERLI